jgi:hypothetical protein
VLVSLSYYTAMAFATEGTLATPEVHDNLDLARKTALRNLASFAKRWWAKILLHRIESNGIGELWNATPKELRDTREMGKLITDADYIGKAMAFHDEVAPNDHRVCFGPLAVASRFHWEEFYEPLWERLILNQPTSASKTRQLLMTPSLTRTSITSWSGSPGGKEIPDDDPASFFDPAESLRG